MTQGSQSLHLSGSKVATNIPLDVNATNALQHMKQELSKLQTENKKLVDQLNCFVSLVQRSWKGDRHATIHLSNIIGLDPPPLGPSNDGTQARPNSEMNVKTRCEQNWERLAMKLLDRECQAVQEEIREYQQRYIQNRQAYMDAVLQDHQQTMSVIPLSRQSSSSTMESVDSRFINHNKALQRMGASPSKSRRAQSAKVRSRPRTAVKDQVKAMDISLKDLVGDMPSSNHFVDTELANTQAFGEQHTITPSQNSKRRPQTSHVLRHAPNTYNDPSRYKKGDLYEVRDSDSVKKPRPVSASSLRETDAVRSRPHSGFHSKKEKAAPPTQAFLTQKNERSLKYESTKPVYVHPKHGRPRKHSDGHVAKLIRSNSHPALVSQTDVISTSSAPKTETKTTEIHGNQLTEVENHHEEEFPNSDTEPVVQNKPPISIRVKSAHTRRPAHIDNFAEEERALREMEADFKNSALTLQKKLGIENSGVILWD